MGSRARRTGWSRWALVLPALLAAACGGGDSAQDALPPPAMARVAAENCTPAAAAAMTFTRVGEACKRSSPRMGRAVGALGPTSPSLTPDELFDWAELQYPALFPTAGRTAGELGPYTFRYYPGTSNYLGVSTGDPDVAVYLYGTETAWQLVRVGAFAGFACSVKPQACIGSVTPAIASEVPAVAQAMVATITSGIGNTQAGSPVPHAPGGLLLALDAQGDIVLATAEGDSGGAALAADTTAVALVRLAFGRLSGLASSQAFPALVRSTAGFPALVDAIRTRWQSGIAPSADPQVLAAVKAVAAQVRQALAAQLQARALQALPTEVKMPLPFAVLPADSLNRAVYIDDTLLGTGILAINATPIHWSIRSTGDETLLPPSTLAQVALGTLTPWLGPDRVHLPDKGGEAFDVVLSQTLESRRTSLSTALQEIIGIALDSWPGGASCNTALAAVAASPDTLAELSGAPSFDSFREYLLALPLEDAAIEDALAACGVQAGTDAPQALLRFTRAISRYMLGLRQLGAVADVVGVPYLLWHISSHWNDDPRTVRVCQGTSLTGRAIRNCAKSLAPNPEQLRLAPGAQATVDLVARDEDDALTAIPPALRAHSSSPATATITGRVVHGLQTGTADITFSEPVLGAFPSKIAVAVVNPRIKPASATIHVGSALDLSLVDTANRSVRAEGSGLTWMSTDESVVAIEPAASLPSWPNAVRVRGLKVGTAQVVIYNPVNGASTAATVTVSAVETLPVMDVRVSRTQSCQTTQVNSTHSKTYCSYTFIAAITCQGGCTDAHKFEVQSVRLGNVSTGYDGQVTSSGDTVVQNPQAYYGELRPDTTGVIPLALALPAASDIWSPSIIDEWNMDSTCTTGQVVIKATARISGESTTAAGTFTCL